MTRARDLGDFIADGAAAELVVDTTTLVVDSTNNRVGIGTASPSQALDVSGAAVFSSTVTANAGVIVDNITIDGTEIDLSSGDLTLDVAGDIILDADGGDVKISDGGTHVGSLRNVSSDFVIQSIISDQNIIFKGNDGGSEFNALSLDMSEAGAASFAAGATFEGDVTLPDKIVHTGDTNTAIRFPAADTISFETAGSERLRIASAGQVGIAGANYGTSGQVLTSGGSGAAPSWVDASGGGGIELTTSEAVVEGDRLAWNFTTGKVEKIARTGGFGAYSGTSARAAYYSMKEIPGTNKIFACVYDNSANQKKVMVIEQSTTDGSLTFGTPVAVSNQPQNNHYMDLVWCSNVNRMLVYYRAANYNMYGELFSVSGTTPTSTYSATISTDQNITEGYSPSAHFDTTANKAVIFYVGDASEFRRGVARVITPSASSFSVSGTQGPRSGSATNYFDASDYPQDFGSTFGNGVHVFNWASNGRYAVAATLSGTTLSFGSILTLNSSMNGRGRRTYTHYLSGASTNNRFAYPHGTGDDVFEYTNSGTTLSSISTQKIYDPQYSSYINLTAYQPSPADGGNPKTFAWSSASNNMKAAFDNEKQNDLYIDTSNGTGAQQVVKSSTSANLRTVCMQNTTGYSVCGDENGNIGYYQPIIDNFYYFVGCAKEAASANTTVKIANSGQVATGLSSLTAGDGYRINYSGGFSSQGSFQTDKTILNGSQRAGINGIALTTTTMLLINDFMYT